MGFDRTDYDVDTISDEDALEVLRQPQPPRKSRGPATASPTPRVSGFASPPETEDTRDLIHALGGFTLAVEHVAAYLRINPEISAREYLDGLIANGLPGAAELPGWDAPIGEQLLYRQRQMAPILLASIAVLDEMARAALQYAALLPPDVVPLPWLQSLTSPPGTGPAARVAWRTARRRLVELRLLTAGEYPEVARIHRIVATYVLQDSPTAIMRPRILSLLGGASWEVYDSDAPPEPWKLDALSAALRHVLRDAGQSVEAPLRDYYFVANAAIGVSHKVKLYRSLDSAGALLDCGHEVIARIAASDPDDVELQHDLSISHGLRGDIAVIGGDMGSALQNFRAAHAIAERLAATDPDDTRFARGLFVTQVALGDVELERGDLVAARLRFATCADIAQRLASSDPANEQWQQDVASSHERLGSVATVEGDLPAALRAHTDELRIAEELAIGDPSNVERQQNLWVSNTKLGNILLTLGDYVGARQRLTDGFAIAEKFAASDTGNAEWQRDLSISHDSLGNLARAECDSPEALRRFDEALSITERLAGFDPSNAELQNDLSLEYAKHADLMDEHDDGNANRFWRSAHNTLEGLKNTSSNFSSEDEDRLQWLRTKAGPK